MRPGADRHSYHRSLSRTGCLLARFNPPANRPYYLWRHHTLSLTMRDLEARAVGLRSCAHASYLQPPTSIPHYQVHMYHFQPLHSFATINPPCSVPTDPGQPSLGLISSPFSLSDGFDLQIQRVLPSNHYQRVRRSRLLHEEIKVQMVNSQRQRTKSDSSRCSTNHANSTIVGLCWLLPLMPAVPPPTYIFSLPLRCETWRL
ncbi:hypothetical protein EDD36DRAFT_11975 [Exophiala viscosa]|uniref:Uncharacterized protein n=1 Tax=Exophiala viscosa TaxID=2486360 RepID=A0AAN6IHL9_9EURO|nr:hypothetical protein EDD36DRAFT_11975 [Exophiala viscosa]